MRAGGSKLKRKSCSEPPGEVFERVFEGTTITAF